MCPQMAAQFIVLDSRALRLFACFRNISALAIKWMWEVFFPLYHWLCISAMDWHPLRCAREDGVLENRASSTSSNRGYFSPLLVPAVNEDEAVFKVTAESWPDFKKNLAKQLFFIYFFFLKLDHFLTPAQGEVVQILVSFWKQVIWEQFKSQIFHILKP